MSGMSRFTQNVVDLLAARRFWFMFVLPMLMFGVVAVATPNLLNFALISLSTVICIAYWPETYRILAEKSPLDEQSFLIIGIFGSWSTVIYMSALTLVWRYLDQPLWIPNSDLTSFRIFAMCGAAYMHIQPHAMRPSVPTQRLLKVGYIAALVVFLGLVALNMDRLRSIWQRAREPHDLHQPMSLKDEENEIYNRLRHYGQSEDRAEDYVVGPLPVPQR